MSFPSASQIKGLLAVAHDLADQSATVILRQFRKPMDVVNKAGNAAFDPVTKADKAAERTIARVIRSCLPEHGILGEEFGQERPDSPFQWVIDPIDGTRSFITGTPMWGTLIGLLHQGAPVLGIMNQPFTRERFWADATTTRARDASGKTRRLATRRCPRVADALMMTTTPDIFSATAEREGFARVRREVRMTRFGGDCYAYCLLASGFVDLVIEANLQTYDVVALIPIVERAGGRMTTWDGKPATSGGRIIASGDPALHEQALKLLNR